VAEEHRRKRNDEISIEKKKREIELNYSVLI
jgi:hypothetical protein